MRDASVLPPPEGVARERLVRMVHLAGLGVLPYQPGRVRTTSAPRQERAPSARKLAAKGLSCSCKDCARFRCILTTFLSVLQAAFLGCVLFLAYAQICFK